MDLSSFGLKKSERTSNGLPRRALLVVPYGGQKLVVAYPLFGPCNYEIGSSLMSSDYSHSRNIPWVSFRPPTTSESLAAAVYDSIGRRRALDNSSLLLGQVVRTSQGFFANPPFGSNGEFVTNERELLVLLNGTEKINGVYIVPNSEKLRDFGFAPYESFIDTNPESFLGNTQSIDAFCSSGLARILGHSGGKAIDLELIAKKMDRPSSIDFSFSSTSIDTPVLMGVGLCSSIPDGDSPGGWLEVVCSKSETFDGYIYGVLEKK
jgi:hypothetical protein